MRCPPAVRPMVAAARAAVCAAALITGVTHLALAQSTTAPVVPDSAAARYVGREVTVEGTVARVKPSQHQRTTFLNFGADYPNHTFSVWVPDSALARVGGPDALAALAGRRVRVRGTVWLQDQKWPAVTLLDSARLVVVPPTSRLTP